MARCEEDIEKEIQRIEGQLLVAKQICRENVGVHSRTLIFSRNLLIS